METPSPSNGVVDNVAAPESFVNKKLIKVGTVEEVHKVIYLNNSRDIFTVHSVRERMKLEEKNKFEREQYLEKVLKEGDVHFFKKQTFGPQYSQWVNQIIYM